MKIVFLLFVTLILATLLVAALMAAWHAEEVLLTKLEEQSVIAASNWDSLTNAWL